MWVEDGSLEEEDDFEVEDSLEVVCIELEEGGCVVLEDLVLVTVLVLVG